MAEAQLQEALQATSKELNRSVGQMAFQYRSASSRRWCCYSLALLLSMHREQQTIAVLARKIAEPAFDTNASSVDVVELPAWRGYRLCARRDVKEGAERQHGVRATLAAAQLVAPRRVRIKVRPPAPHPPRP